MALVGITACSAESGDRSHADGPADMPAPQRVFADATWDTLWTVGGEGDEETLLYPNGVLTADDGHVYVLDPGEYRVTALRATDDGVAWMRGRKGDGPGEFRSLRGAFLSNAGELYVLDPDAGRMVVLDTAGRHLRNLRFGDEIGGVLSACVLPDGTFVAMTGSPDRPIVRMSADGQRVLSRTEFPWLDLADVSPLVTQAKLTRIPDENACLLTLTNGRGFARYDGDAGRFGEPHPYVEPLPLPEIVEERRTMGDTEILGERLSSDRYATSHVMVDGGEIAMLFAGTTEDRQRLVDLYDSDEGAYAR